SMFGLWAAWSGVRWPSRGCDSSAQPSGMTMTYFMTLLGDGIVDGRGSAARQRIDLRHGLPHRAQVRIVRKQHDSHASTLSPFVLDHRGNADLMPREHAIDGGEHANPVVDSYSEIETALNVTCRAQRNIAVWCPQPGRPE